MYSKGIDGLLDLIRVNAENLMGCNGYKARDGMGTENSEWLGPRLYRILELVETAKRLNREYLPEFPDNEGRISYELAQKRYFGKC